MNRYSLRDNSDPGRIGDFDRGECSGNCCCDLNFLETLIAGYNAIWRTKWEKCLSTKWSIGDCIAGCHNDIDAYAFHEDSLLVRNSHQYCIPITSIKEAADKLGNAPFNDSDTVDFESFYNWITKTIGDVNGIGDLCKYDIALRMGWNYSGGRIQPSEYVYLHQGALRGAKALVRLSRQGKEYIQPTVKLDFRVRIDVFCEDLQQLGANHLENFLCIYHRQMTYWAEGVEADAKSKKKNLTQQQQ